MDAVRSWKGSETDWQIRETEAVHQLAWQVEAAVQSRFAKLAGLF